MPRVLLLLPTATYRAEDFLAAAAAVGAEVVIASDRRQALHGAMGDRALRVDLHRPERAAAAIVELSQRVALDAVVAVDDGGVMAAALASERLGFPHNPPSAVAATRDKAAMRQALDAAGVTQPGFVVLAPGDDAGLVPFPAVLKPVALSGSRGVIRVDDAAAARAAVTRIRAILTAAGEDAGRPGPGGGLRAGCRGGGGGARAGRRARGARDLRQARPARGAVLRGDDLRHAVPASRRPAAAGRGHSPAAAAAALGLREGPVHAEVRLDGDRAWVLELAARSIGGLCSRALRFGADISLEEVILRHALALPLGPHVRERAASGVMMLPIERAGTLRGVGGVEDARAVAGVQDVRITIPAGRPVVPLPEGDRYLGFVFARGETPAHVEAALRQAHAALDVIVD